MAPGDELVLIGFQIGKEPEIFEQFIAQLLGLVDQQSDNAMLLELFD